MSKSPSEYPRLFPRPDQTIAGVGRALREGRTSCVKILEGCLGQVDEWESRAHAWVLLDRHRALERARELDDELKAGNDRGPLHGIPIGIKDIIDVAGMPTACGSKRWANRITAADAPVVVNLRESGAVLLGKTVTTPYAWIDPPVTRNPWDLERTPGGSSSGSAAAVACGMSLAAIGSQTGGSITRPASFCGLAGMKPTHGEVSTSGVLPLAPSLDHVGPIASTVADLRSVFHAIHRDPARKEENRAIASIKDRPFRLGRLRGYFERRAETVMQSAFDEAVRILGAGGVIVVELEDPVDFEKDVGDHRRVMAAEAAATHSSALDAEPDDYPPQIRKLIVEGRSYSALDYLNARNRALVSRTTIMATLASGGIDALITPATVGPAPDTSTTGDPAFNSPWSYTGLPTVSFPIGLTPEGLPLAVQLTGSFLHDDQLLDVGQYCEQAIRTFRQ